MALFYKTGNALDADEPVLLNGVNSRGKYASGIAKAIRNRYPEAYQAYIQEFNDNGLELGQLIVALCSDRIILHGVTQAFYGYDGKCYVDYEAINTVLVKTVEYCRKNNISSVSMPLIGAGLGGGSWKIISKMIENEFTDIDAIVYLLDGVIPEN